MKKESIDGLLAELGTGIRELRLSLNLSQQVVADRSAVSIKAVKNLESGVGASVRSFIAICRTLGKLDWMNMIPPPEGESPLEMWKRLNKPKRQRAGAVRVQRTANVPKLGMKSGPYGTAARQEGAIHLRCECL